MPHGWVLLLRHVTYETTMRIHGINIRTKTIEVSRIDRMKGESSEGSVQSRIGWEEAKRNHQSRS